MAGSVAESVAVRGSKAPSGDAAPGLVARQGALHLIGAVLDRGAMLDEAGLRGSPAERAEARGLADLTLRRLGQIDDLLGRFVGRMPKPPVDHVLRLMAAELIFAGTAPHAAVDLGVRLVKRDRGAAKLAGLVNAVGRRLAEQGAEIAAGQDAARLNTPGWLWQHLVADWGAEAARAMALAHLTPAPHDLTPNDLKLTNPAEAGALARELGAEVLATGSLRLADRPQISALPGFAEGAWWAQDAAAALPARLIPDPQGKRVLDLCASPGGKTVAIAADARDTGVLVACDARARRVRLLHDTVKTSGAACVRVVHVATSGPLPFAPVFDRVLVDAPCSGLGTIRRDPDIRWRRGERDLASLAHGQLALLERAAALVRPRGRLVYATCSSEPDENEAVVDAFLSRHDEFELVNLRGDASPHLIPLLDEQGMMRTLPFAHELEAFFAAALVRRH